MQTQWDEIADVVVVGKGGAGAVTAITAQEQGADVLVLEKQPRDSHCTSTGMSGGNQMLPRDEGAAMEYLEALYRVPGGLSWTDQDVLRVYTRYAMGNIAWIEEHGGHGEEGSKIGEHTEIGGYDAFIRYSFAGMGYGLQRFLNSNIEAKKIPVSYNTRARRLITDYKGRIIGVEVETDSQTGKKNARIGATKGVVLACGGFEHNEAMKLNYLPVHPTYFKSHTSSTGDGIKMALAVGADLWHMNCVSASLVAKFPDFPIAFGTSFNGTRFPWKKSMTEIEPEKRPGYLIVARDGKRFTNEDAKGHCAYYELTFLDTQRMLYPRVPSYWVFDRRRMELTTLTRGISGAAGPYRLYEWSKDNSKELESGWILTSDSIRGLAGKLEVPPINLEQTINDYNSCCAKGKDTEFGRRSESLIPLDTPPFFAVKLWPGGPNTQGGPRKNAKAQVLNVNGEPIPGLYAVGELGSIFGMLYPGGGSNLAECIAMGRVAGENVSHEHRE